ncbi:MAG: porin [Rubellimicrobium sp.]|nr:porin [Rubellimicrobium sp.]
MKRILLASASIFGMSFAGIAAAEVSFGGSATLGYNDTVEDNFYWSAELDVTLSQELDNGVTAGATFAFEFADGNVGQSLSADSFVIFLETDMGGLYFGDVDPVAESEWDGVDGSGVAGFNDKDIHLDTAEFDAMLRGEVMFGGIEAMVSWGVGIDGNRFTDNDLDAMQVYVRGDLGNFGFQLAYQDEFGPTPQIFGVAVSTSFAGADAKLAYLDDGDQNSVGVSLSYPIGPVTAGAYYTSNSVSDDSWGISADYADGPISVSAFYDVDQGADGVFGLEGSYDVGNGLMVMAGILDNGDAYYVAATYDLGGGASLLVAFADDENNGLNDEIGDPELMAGATVELNFSF